MMEEVSWINDKFMPQNVILFKMHWNVWGQQMKDAVENVFNLYDGPFNWILLNKHDRTELSRGIIHCKREN